MSKPIVTYILLIILALSPWIPILFVDARLKEAVSLMCRNQAPTTSCSLLTVMSWGNGGSISFYAFRNGKFYRFIREPATPADPPKGKPRVPIP